jgi:plasmid maintenance system antidote protein VapI
MTSVTNKHQRLNPIVALVPTHPQGLTQSDLAKRLGVNRSTISRIDTRSLSISSLLTLLATGEDGIHC